MPGEKYIPQIGKSSKKQKTMPAGSPADLTKPAKTGLPSIPTVRPTTMRNLTPWKGFKPGSY